MNKILSVVLSLVLILNSLSPVLALEGPEVAAPTAPIVAAPSAPTVNQPSAPAVNQPVAPTVNQPTAPTVTQPTPPSSDPYIPPVIKEPKTQTNTQPTQQTNNLTPTQSQPSGDTIGTTAQESTNTSETAQPTSNAASSLPGVTADGNGNGAFITTGDATNTAIGITNANTNIVNDGASTNSAPNNGATVENNGNTNNGDNNSSTTVDNTNTNTQNNSAIVVNNVDQQTNTGNNSASRNVGDATIVTGDANTAATVVTNVNTNMDGVMVSEFNINDHQGDYILDFGSNCIQGCGGTGNVSNTGNTNNGDNTANGTFNNTDNTFQNNDATIENNITLDSNSGNNHADRNAMGNVSIETGDANTAASVVTFANNNVSGNIYYGTVNIFGNLNGDIIFPEEYYNTLIASNQGNTNNGDNTATASNTNTSTTTQNNLANIDNNIIVNATTGDNEADRNAGGGTTSVTSGDADVDINAVNIANNNIEGNWFLVLVNDMGNWVGNIFGEDGQAVAGSENMQFVVDEFGNVSVANQGNTNDGNNTATNTSTNTANVEQTNTANITNNLALNANTGDNTASRNAGGDTTIDTGDANVVANLVNFVNNNIASGGNLFVTVVNVFGDWTGDFLTPWSKKDKTIAQNQPAVGGLSESNNSNNSSSDGNSNNSSLSSNSSSEEGQNSVSNPTPTPKKKTLSFFGLTNDDNSGGNSTGGSVASAQTDSSTSTDTTGVGAREVASAVSTKKAVTINLAWLLLALPAGVAYLVIKRRVTFIRSAQAIQL